MPNITIHLKGTKGFVQGTVTDEDLAKLTKNLGDDYEYPDVYTMQIDETTKALIPADQIAYIEVQEQA